MECCLPFVCGGSNESLSMCSSSPFRGSGNETWRGYSMSQTLSFLRSDGHVTSRENDQTFFLHSTFVDFRRYFELKIVQIGSKFNKIVYILKDKIINLKFRIKRKTKQKLENKVGCQNLVTMETSNKRVNNYYTKCLSDIDLRKRHFWWCLPSY